MKKLISVVLLGVLLMISCAYGDAKLDNQLQQVISQQRAKNLITAISLSVGLTTHKTIKNKISVIISIISPIFRYIEGYSIVACACNNLYYCSIYL